MIKWFIKIHHQLVIRLTPNFLIRKLIKCSDVSRRLADMDNLSWFQKLRTYFHVSYCPPCYNYLKQLGLLESGCRKFFTQKLTDEQIKKIEELSHKIVEKEST